MSGAWDLASVGLMFSNDRIMDVYARMQNEDSLEAASQRLLQHEFQGRGDRMPTDPSELQSIVKQLAIRVLLTQKEWAN